MNDNYNDNYRKLLYYLLDVIDTLISYLKKDTTISNEYKKNEIYIHENKKKFIIEEIGKL